MRCLRFVVLSLACLSLLPGCGGGGESGPPSEQLTPANDPTLDPSKDSTMNPTGQANPVEVPK